MAPPAVAQISSEEDSQEEEEEEEVQEHDEASRRRLFLVYQYGLHGFPLNALLIAGDPITIHSSRSIERADDAMIWTRTGTGISQGS